MHTTATTADTNSFASVTSAARPRRSRSRLTLLVLSSSLCLALALSACGSDSDTAATTTAAPAPTTAKPTPTTAKPTPTTAEPTPTTAKPTPTTAKPTPTTAAPTPTTAHAGPAFVTFDVTRSAKCVSGNADFTLAYTTKDIVDMSIDIGSTGFKETAGYGPNETGVIASVPCSGAGQSTIQMKGCNASGACGESAKVPVTIAAG